MAGLNEPSPNNTECCGDVGFYPGLLLAIAAPDPSLPLRVSGCLAHLLRQGFLALPEGKLACLWARQAG